MFGINLSLTPANAAVLLKGNEAYPPAVYGAISTTADGSEGQTYTLNVVGASDIQWYRMQLASPFSRTIIPGATSSDYVSTADDVGYRLVALYTVDGVKAAAKSYHVVLSAPILLESFESTTGVTGSATFRSIDTERKVQGAGALSVMCNGIDSNNQARKTTSVAVVPADLGVIAFHLHTGSWQEEAAMTSGAGLRLTTGSQTPYYTSASDPGPLSTAILDGFWHGFDVSEYTDFINAGAGNLHWYWGPTHYSPYVDRVVLDALMGNAKGRPTITFGFDDAVDNQITTAMPIMVARGIKPTFYVPWRNLGASGRYTLAQLQSYYDAGQIDIQLDGTGDDSLMTALADANAVADEIQAGIDWAVSAGFGVPHHLCYPNGSFNSSTGNVRYDLLCTAPGDNTIVAGSGVTFPADIVAGTRVIFANGPKGLLVTSRVSDTVLQVSATVPTRATETLTRFGVARGPLSIERMKAALVSKGIRTARTTNGGSFYSRMGLAGRGIILPGESTTGANLASLMSLFNKVKLRGNSAELYFHGITNSTASGLNMRIDTFTEICDYVASERDAGNWDVLCVKDRDARDYGASVPL